MRIEAAGREDLAFAGDHLSAGTDDDGNVRLNVRISSLPDTENIAILDADIRLHDPPMVEDEGIGDDGVDGAILVGDLALAHAVADDLAAAEFHFVPVDREILLDFDDEISVGEPNPVARSRTEHVGVDAAR